MPAGADPVGESRGKVLPLDSYREELMFSSRRVFVSTILLFTIACASGDPSSPNSPSPAPNGSSSAVTIPMNAEVLGDRAYVPGVVTVAVGNTVTWMNTDSVSHTSTSDPTGWDSGIVAPGAAFSRSFQSAGSFRYHCAIHPGMIGTVVVR